MAIPTFRSFWSNVRHWNGVGWRKEYKFVVDGVTGAPVGIQSPNANGPDGIWAPVPLSATQIGAPTADILADLNATYQNHNAPYERYRSDGTQFVPLDGESGTVIPAGQVWHLYSPLTITEASGPFIVQGAVVITAQPA